jgi:hypothetical protein
MDGFDQHATLVVHHLLEGTVTPFLGAGANLCGRPRDYSWKLGDDYFPSGTELALHLAEYFRYQGDDARDLMAVATYAEILQGLGPLYKELRDIFDREVPPTSLHDFLARCPEVIRDRDRDTPAPLIVTTNYDLLLEHALTRKGEEFDVVAYVADGDGAGKFLHYPPSGLAPILITSPSTYDRLSFERTTILKIHGTFDPLTKTRDSYVISEDQYVDYLTTDIWDAIPAAVIDRLKWTHFLFLGYAMRDWNLMVVLRRLGLMPPDFKAWAVQLHQTELDKERWFLRHIDSFDVDLDEYVDALAAELARLP